MLLPIIVFLAVSSGCVGLYLWLVPDRTDPPYCANCFRLTAGVLEHTERALAVLEELCGRLEAAYRERPVAIINMIARPNDPLQSLADAFKFKGGDK